MAWYRTVYEGRPFVRVLNQPPELTHAVGTNYALIHATSQPMVERLQVRSQSTISSKAHQGQAIQAMNLALGLAEETWAPRRRNVPMLTCVARRLGGKSARLRIWVAVLPGQK